MSPTPLAGPEIPSASGNTKRLVIFLHGLGADGHDLISLAPMLAVPDAHFLSPHAPFACDMGPYGHQWFSLQDRHADTILKGIAVAAPLLDAYIDAQCARFSVTPKDVALIGFSQGSMMSLYTAPRRGEALAGVIGISGALFGPERLNTDTKSRPPICLIHGTADEVVPFAAMGAAEAALQATGFTVEAHARPGLGHGIDEAGIAHASAFLADIFGY